MNKGIIFDFNGTLFWDSLLHDEAWKQFTKENKLRVPTKLEMRMNIHGKGSEDIMRYVFNKRLSINDIHKYTQEKEAIYRQLVLSDEKYKDLAPGALNLLNHLKSINIPITIATSSEGVNVNFFYEHFKLDRWFDRNKTVYDNGEIKLKPAPDIFLMAANKIEVPISKCMIIEDSASGVIAAKASGANKVVYIENDAPIDFCKVKPYVNIKIKRLDELIEFI